MKEGFLLPRGDTKSLYFLWHYGNQLERYKPYMFLTGADMASSAEKGELAKCRTVIDEVERVGVAEGCWSPLQVHGTPTSLAGSR